MKQNMKKPCDKHRDFELGALVLARTPDLEDKLGCRQLPMSNWSGNLSQNM